MKRPGNILPIAIMAFAIVAFLFFIDLSIAPRRSQPSPVNNTANNLMYCPTIVLNDIELNKLSGRARALVQKINTHHSLENIRSNEDGSVQLTAACELNGTITGTISADALRALGATVNSSLKNLYTVLIPTTKLANILEQNGVESFSTNFVLNYAQ